MVHFAKNAMKYIMLKVGNIYKKRKHPFAIPNSDLIDRNMSYF